MATLRASIDRHCPNCGYALAGLPSRICSECGFNFDPVVLRWRQRSSRRRNWLTSLCVMIVAMYTPFRWLLFIDYPWSAYRWHWLHMWPILPGLPATILLRLATGVRVPDWVEMTCMGVFAVAALLLFTWLGSRGRRGLIVTAILVFAGSTYLAWVAYILFRT